MYLQCKEVYLIWKPMLRLALENFYALDRLVWCAFEKLGNFMWVLKIHFQVHMYIRGCKLDYAGSYQRDLNFANFVKMVKTTIIWPHITKLSLNTSNSQN